MSSEGVKLLPLTGIARKKRSDSGIPRKSNMDSFCDAFMRMSDDEQATAIEVLRQLQRMRAPQPKEEECLPNQE